MAEKANGDVHLETLEEAEDEGAEPGRAGSAVLNRSVTNKRLAQAGYYDFPA